MLATEHESEMQNITSINSPVIG